MKKASVIGYGYWGSKIAQVAQKSGLFDIVHICDTNLAAQEQAKNDFPKALVNSSLEHSNPNIDVAFVMTPASVHKQHVDYFKAYKHVLVTKPFKFSNLLGQRKDDPGSAKSYVTCVDYTFLYSSAIQTLKDHLHLVGLPLYYHSDRLSSGIYRNDCNILEDLAPHDLSIIFSLFPNTEIVKSSFKSMFSSNVFHNDYATLNFTLSSNLHVVVNYAWSFFKKERGVSIVGDKGVLYFDDAKSGTTECVTFTPHKFNGYGSNPQTFFETTGPVMNLANPSISALEQEMISFNGYIDNGIPSDVLALMKKITKYTEMLTDEGTIFTAK